MFDFQSRFFRLLTLIYQRELQFIREMDITLLEYYTLQILSFSSGTTPKEIAMKLSLPKSSVTYIINSLEKGGLAERRLDTKDRRRWRVFLTNQGEDMIKRIFARKSEFLMPIFGNISEHETTYWNKLMDNLLRGFET